VAVEVALEVMALLELVVVPQKMLVLMV